MRDCVGICHLEAALLQIFAVIENRAADEKRALWIDNQPNVLCWHENIPLLRSLHQIHYVLQAGAASTDNLEAQRTVGLAFFFKQRRQLTRGFFGNADQAFVADLVIKRWRLSSDGVAFCSNCTTSFCTVSSASRRNCGSGTTKTSPVVPCS